MHYILFGFEYHFGLNLAEDVPAVLIGVLCSDDIFRERISTLQDLCTLAPFVTCINFHAQQTLLTGIWKFIL